MIAQENVLENPGLDHLKKRGSRTGLYKEFANKPLFILVQRNLTAFAFSILVQAAICIKVYIYINTIFKIISRNLREREREIFFQQFFITLEEQSGMTGF